MTKRGKRSGGNYKKAILESIQAGDLQPQAGKVIQVDVIHKDGCSFLRGGECDCDPDILQRSDTQKSEHG